MASKRLCFSCDLKDNPTLIEEYKEHHAPGNVWPEITKSIKDVGVLNIQIYLTGNRMFMIMEVDEHFSLDKKSKMDKSNPKVQEWENLMWNYQQSLPWAKPGEKWVLLNKIFELD